MDPTRNRKQGNPRRRIVPYGSPSSQEEGASDELVILPSGAPRNVRSRHPLTSSPVNSRNNFRGFERDSSISPIEGNQQVNFEDDEIPANEVPHNADENRDNEVPHNDDENRDDESFGNETHDNDHDFADGDNNIPDDGDIPNNDDANSQNIVRKKRGENVEREIQELRRTTNNLLPFAPFSRVVKELIFDVSGGKDFRIQKEAIQALREASEAHLISLFEASYLITAGAKRWTLEVDDLQLAQRIWNYK